MILIRILFKAVPLNPTEFLFNFPFGSESVLFQQKVTIFLLAADVLDNCL